MTGLLNSEESLSSDIEMINEFDWEDAQSGVERPKSTIFWKTLKFWSNKFIMTDENNNSEELSYDDAIDENMETISIAECKTNISLKAIDLEVGAAMSMAEGSSKIVSNILKEK